MFIGFFRGVKIINLHRDMKGFSMRGDFHSFLLIDSKSLCIVVFWGFNLSKIK